MKRLPWFSMPDFHYAEADTVVLRMTEGNSEWVDCSDKTYKLVAKTEPWRDYTDFSDALFTVTGEMPNEKNKNPLDIRY